MQIYTVQVYENFIRENSNSIVETNNGISVWYGGYDELTGISVDHASSDSFVV
jgi:hypothetical protein